MGRSVVVKKKKRNKRKSEVISKITNLKLQKKIEYQGAETRTCRALGGVYMIPVRVSFWYEFIPVLTYRSVFVYMIPVKNLIPVQLIPV